ncbi:MAG TPA: class I SAM-dependent methyltransferase [Gaiellaceae bacterium]|nr:class I SAM-dependent methyltransferase [Gaiellaceae bacterium]
MRGRGDRPLDRHVRAEQIVGHSSSKRPSVEPGEQAILYAAVWQALFGVVEIAGIPEHDPARERWAWRFPIRPLAVVPDLEGAPAVEAAGIFPQSIWRHSHIRLSAEQFSAGRELVERAAAPERPQELVARGYDAAADAFAAWQRQVKGSTRLERLDELLGLLPARPDVLELGSGAAVRSTRILAERARLVGVDISAEQVRRARERVPAAQFVHADLTELELEPATFDAVVAFYVLNHVPREQLAGLLRRIAAWLRRDGCLLATFGATDNPGWRGRWVGGVETFFSGYEPEVTLRLVREAGLDVVRGDLETIEEPNGPATFLWVLARRPE